MSETRTRCRHVHIDGTRCPQLALRHHDLCKNHHYEQQLAVIRAHHVPDIQPILPLVSFSDDRDYDEILVNLSLITAAFAQGNLTPAEAKRMNALLRTCDRTLRCMRYTERVRDAIELDLARTLASLKLAPRKQPSTVN